MTAKELGEQAAIPAQSFGQDGLPECPLAGGLTKRELFAAMAMQGILAANRWIDNETEQAVEQADLLLAELAKGQL